MTTTPPLASVPIRSAEDLTARWRALLDPPIFGARSLWLSWIDADGLMLPIIIPVDDIPLTADPGMLEGLRRVHIGVARDQLPRGGALAMALCRPGVPRVTKSDEAWAQSLREALDGVPVAPLWTLHLAAAGHVTELVPPPFQGEGPRLRVTRCGERWRDVHSSGTDAPRACVLSPGA